MASGLSVVTSPRIGESSPNYSANYGASQVTRERSRTESNICQPKPTFPQFNRSLSVSQTFKPNDKIESNVWIRKRNELNYKRRRYSFASLDPKYKKRRKNDPIELPTKFLLGGNIHDPLNLSSLEDDVNQVTPQSSPLPTPKHRTQVEVLIPANINDPLNLNCGEEFDESSLISPKGKNKSRKRKRKRTESETTANSEDNAEDNEVKRLSESAAKPQKLRFSDTVKVVDKIVSPVIPQGVSSCGKYRRTITDSQKGAQEESTAHIRDGKRKRNKANIKPSAPRFRPKDVRFQYGNYNRYYGYRNMGHVKDIRLQNFKREWFESKHVLDLGCNAGHITLMIAKECHPNRIVGVDIDETLIKIARKNIKHYANDNSSQTEDHSIASQNISSDVQTYPLASKFPKNVSFFCENYVPQNDDVLSKQKCEYDCVLCLSLTKWIHLNWGDEGLKRVFKRIFAQLKPGGKLILEAQSWSSYKRKKKTTPTTLHNFNSIKFKPEQFNEYLLSREVGFTKRELIDTPLHPSKGFRRPIYLFSKPDVCLRRD